MVKGEDGLCRSPHGERGLKWRAEDTEHGVQVALLMESVD